MARSRFIRDTGLTVRMTSVMFVLGGLFVALVAALMYYFPAYAVVIAVIALGILAVQWWTSDIVAMRAMRAREVSPEEAPELHGMIDRLCSLADMPKPRVGVSESNIPNAFATGRSPDRAVVCVTRGILQKLDAEELEGVLAHELSHVAHRDVLVMTLASSAGVIVSLLGHSMRFGGFGLGRSRNNQAGAIGVLVLIAISIAVYAISFLALRLLSRYRELCADRSGAYLTQKPGQLASALQKITGEMAAIPQRDLRSAGAMNAFFIAPAISGVSLRTLSSTHPSLEQRLEQLSKIATELGRPMD